MENHKTGIDLKKTFVIAMAAYVLLAAAFYLLAGHQLHFRASRGDLAQPPAESASVELADGAVVEQTFCVNIQRLESVSVQWGTYGRANAGTAYMELYDTRDGSLLMSRSVDVAALAEGDVVTMTAETPIETVYGVPLLLRVWADSATGSAATPLVSLSAGQDGFALTVNGAPAEGVLCFSAGGEDYIWIGLHYWALAGCGGVLLMLLAAGTWQRTRHGKRSYVVSALIVMKKYRFLIRQLVSRDFKTKYKRSVLGMFWSFLNPLLTMAVQYMVFSNLFRFDVPHYQAYLIIGIVLFNFFTESTGMSLMSIIGNANLITKVYVPKYIYPLTRVLSSLVNLVISLLPLLLVTLLSGLVPTKAYLLVPFALLCLTLFSLGIGLLLSALMVFFRDVQFLWGVLTMIWMYATPIFYPASILPEKIAWVLDVNPLYYYITFARTCFMEGISPEPMVYVKCFLMAMGALLAGALVFRKSQDQFVLYL